MLAVLIGLPVLGTALPALADPGKTPLPADLQPVPEPPPPPAGYQPDPALEPQVTIVQKGETKEEQYRLNGKLYMVKVTPPHGVSYYLVDSRGDGVFSRMEPTDSGLRVPMWVIKNF
ncbi:MAG: DUF2782 domain-containing protein [Rhodocyclaceae bacterium]|nr:DUF2782 domain-containing protein [Rhodocyclaceae bacterium]